MGVGGGDAGSGGVREGVSVKRSRRTTLSSDGLRESALERDLATQIRVARLPTPQREYVFLSGRRFRADFAFVDHSLIVEVEGGVFRSRRTGRRGVGHTSTAQILRDMEKSNLAQLAGWRFLRVAAPHIRSGQALAWIEEALT